MRCLYISLDRGAGVSLIGDLFLDILKRSSGISSIDLYTSQCNQIGTKPLDKSYDFTIINDLSYESNVYQNLVNNNNLGIIINISHGTLREIPDWVDWVIDLNFEYNCNKFSNLSKVFPLRFVPGNIWRSYTPLDQRVNSPIFSGRICESKLPLKILSKLGFKINVCGNIVDPSYFNLISEYINYLGEFSHRDLVKIYNNHKFSILFSQTECLSISLREQILCGVTPIVVDSTGYTDSILRFINKFSSINQDFLKSIVLKDLSAGRYLLNFEQMISNFLLAVSGIIGHKLNIKNNSSGININNLHNNSKAINYKYDIVTWDF